MLRNHPMSETRPAANRIISFGLFEHVCPNFSTAWSGDVHNGGARMSSSLCALSSNTLIQTAIYDHSEPDVEDLAINYRSCTMYANQDFVVEPNGSLDFEAEFIAPVAMGTWPAFWLSAMERWPPEIDMAEWKGSGMTSFNTFNASDQVDALDMEYPNLAYGEGKVERSRGVNVSRDLPDLNRWKGGDFRFRRSSPSMMWMEQTTQMEGSSGSPGSLTGELCASSRA